MSSIRDFAKFPFFVMNVNILVIAGTVEDYDRLKLEYNGFCPVALLSGGNL